jgi:hypothetical protein
MRLEPEDVQQVRLMLARRDQHLKRLYRNIQRLYGEVNRLRLSQGQGTASEAGSPIPDVAAAERMVLALRNRVQELEKSMSWRVTAPIRTIKRMLTRRG